MTTKFYMPYVNQKNNSECVNFYAQIFCCYLCRFVQKSADSSFFAAKTGFDLHNVGCMVEYITERL